ncbi:PadR family transcriptional regulator [Paenibacillus methanolicus]|uniref:DNA-binding PadR family transcriptional regulator n=1 Tax=Paenibacillus methanolicus TaxID=582686 RepID=A0A5S5C6P6_9BACL|nr:helix-turn-helix transcriptional regulator [Paenibacillus methanolicus]TYP74066.1 DNA-binding PadR family transcriptional regulator [Paenibacillus methanolicus]
MEFVVLGLLLLKSHTLYELKRSFQLGIALFYSVSNGSLQAALKKLEREGAIGYEERVENGRNKKVYSPTNLGRAAFYAWMETDLPAGKLEATALSKLFFLGLLDGNDRKQAVLRRIIQAMRAAEQELRALDASLAMQQVEEPYQQVFRYQTKTLDYGLGAHRFAVDWFEGLLAELEAAEKA